MKRVGRLDRLDAGPGLRRSRAADRFKRRTSGPCLQALAPDPSSHACTHQCPGDDAHLDRPRCVTQRGADKCPSSHAEGLRQARAHPPATSIPALAAAKTSTPASASRARHVEPVSAPKRDSVKGCMVRHHRASEGNGNRSGGLRPPLSSSPHARRCRGATLTPWQMMEEPGNAPARKTNGRQIGTRLAPLRRLRLTRAECPISTGRPCWDRTNDQRIMSPLL